MSAKLRNQLDAVLEHIKVDAAYRFIESVLADPATAKETMTRMQSGDNRLRWDTDRPWTTDCYGEPVIGFVSFFMKPYGPRSVTRAIAFPVGEYAFLFVEDGSCNTYLFVNDHDTGTLYFAWFFNFKTLDQVVDVTDPDFPVVSYTG